MAKYDTKTSKGAVDLELRRVYRNEFLKNSKSLDNNGNFPLCAAAGNNYGLFFEKNNVIAFAKGSENLSRVTGFAVHQNYRGRGYGKMAIEKLKEMAKNNGKRLVVDALPTTYEFFQNCGLKITDHAPGEVWLRDDGD